MFHIPIVDTDNPSHQIEITHHDHDAPKGYWNKATLCPDHIKINVFIEGDFSIFIHDKSYRPMCGDICFLPPAQLHCGQVESQTHLNYFQLDIGLQALDGISDGRNLLERLIENSKDGQHFLRPKAEDNGRVIKLCHRMESAVTQANRPLALAYVLEILTSIDQLYKTDKDIPTVTLSKITANVIQHIKEHYSEKITIADLSSLLGVSSTYLSLLFKKEIGMGVHAYLTEYRVIQSLTLLRENSVADTCYQCGFCDSSHFISAFKQRLNCTPAVYKKQFFI